MSNACIKDSAINTYENPPMSLYKQGLDKGHTQTQRVHEHAVKTAVYAYLATIKYYSIV